MNDTFFKDVFPFKEAQKKIIHLREQLRLAQIIIINYKIIKLSIEGVKRK